MTIQEALISISSYPIPVATIDKVAVNRGLDITNDYTATVSISREYRLCEADLYYWLYTAPNLTEQQIGINLDANAKKGYLKKANDIYLEFDDPKFSGKRYGFIGDNWNG